jgi:hypothetical protein
VATRQLRVHARPDAPSPEGEVVVPVGGGGVTILHRAGVRLMTGGAVRVRLSRPGTAIVRLWPTAPARRALLA